MEVLTQDIAGQKHRSNAEAPAVNFGRNEVLISSVLFGLAHVSNGRVIEKTVRAGSGMVGNQDFCAHRISRGNREGDLVTNSDTRSKKTGQEQLGLIAKQADGCVLPQFDIRHTFTTDRNGRHAGSSTSTVDGHFGEPDCADYLLP